MFPPDRTGKKINWSNVLREDRRHERERARRETARKARSLYVEQGLDTTEIGEMIGLDSSNVSRLLRSAGVTMRSSSAGRHATGTGPHSRTRQLVHARATSCCERCGRNLTWSPGHIHHRRPWSMGGRSDPAINAVSNLLLLCVDCHGHVESWRTEAQAGGYLVPQGQEPAWWPVTYPPALGGGRWLLDDSGDRVRVEGA